METPMTKSLATLATEALSYFETGKLADGDEYYFVREASPVWVNEMVRAAHGDMLPDDIRYDMIVQALGTVSNFDEKVSQDDAQEEMMQVEAPIYTSELTAWLASNVNRYSYCDAAIEEYGASTTADYGMINRLQMGWSHEFSEVASAVISALVAQMEGGA